MHALVLMAPNGTTPPRPEQQADHEQFIDRLDQENRVVLGGGLEPPAAQFAGA